MARKNGHKTLKTISDLSPDSRNANAGTPRGQQMVEDSLRTYGAGRSILADKHGVIIAGNKTLQSASDIDLPIRVIETDGKELVVVQRTDLDLKDAKTRELGVMDNRAGQVGLEWNAEILAQLKDEGVELSGMFTEKELAAILPQGESKDAEPQIDKAVELQQKWQVATGEVIALGSHRLMCGDSTNKADVDALLCGDKVEAIITDPPYGMNLDASFSNSIDNPAKGIKASRGYQQIAGDDKPFDVRPFLERFADVKEQFWWGADYYADTLPRGGSWLAWDKRASVEGVKYSSAEFELCWSRTPHHRRMLRVPWFGLIGTEQQDTKKRLAAAQKPLQVIEPLIEFSKASVVLDLYVGSGTTLVAAENLNRTCYAMEISPEYCAVILERMTTAFPHLKIEREAITRVA